MAKEQLLPAQKSRTTKGDLILANKMLATKELGVLDTLGHLSVRNPDNPNHFFITRDVSAGLATVKDVIEDDLDCNPITGPRKDQDPEVYVHCSIYKARPDVMSVVHAHTPEIVAFSLSSVAPRSISNNGRFIADGLPKLDLGGPAVDSMAKGKLVAEALGKKPAILLTGHGEVVVDGSMYTLVSRADDLKLNSQIQMAAIQLGGKLNYVEPLPGIAASTPAPGDSAPTPVVPSGSGGGTALDRAWEFFRHLVASEN
jgi:HCOMODA/2-hydroxy-3-carboxy-muconic semialdehyde decarboxylase